MRPVLAALVILTFAAALPAAAQQAPAAPMTSAPAAPIDEFGAKVRAFLLAHPEVLAEAVQELQRRHDAAQAEAAKAAIAAHRNEIFRDPASPVAGNPVGDVTLVEFFDYNCPYCRKVAPDIWALPGADPGLRLVFKEFAILGPTSEFAARVALAAQRQGRYLPVHQALMRAEQPLTEDKVFQAAAGAGADVARLKRDMADPSVDAELARTRALADALGIAGTPGFVVGDVLIPGAVERAALEAAIAEARGSKGAPR
jgi:protein-disulfide isomerase